MYEAAVPHLIANHLTYRDLLTTRKGGDRSRPPKPISGGCPVSLSWVPNRDLAWTWAATGGCPAPSYSSAVCRPWDRLLERSHHDFRCSDPVFSMLSYQSPSEKKQVAQPGHQKPLLTYSPQSVYGGSVYVQRKATGFSGIGGLSWPLWGGLVLRAAFSLVPCCRAPPSSSPSHHALPRRRAWVLTARFCAWNLLLTTCAISS